MVMEELREISMWRLANSENVENRARQRGPCHHVIIRGRSSLSRLCIPLLAYRDNSAWSFIKSPVRGIRSKKSNLAYMYEWSPYLENNSKTTSTKKLHMPLRRIFPLILVWFWSFYVVFSRCSSFLDIFRRQPVARMPTFFQLWNVHI